MSGLILLKFLIYFISVIDFLLEFFRNGSNTPEETKVENSISTDDKPASDMKPKDNVSKENKEPPVSFYYIL